MSAVIVTGLGVSPGTGVGTVVRMAPALETPVPQTLADTGESEDSALSRLSQAIDTAAAELTERIERTTGESREVLAATRALVTDRGLSERVSTRIGTGEEPETAVWEAVAELIAAFTDSGGVFADRVRDLEDIRERIVCALRGQAPPGVPVLREPSVLVAADLSPADTATLDPELVTGLVTEAGGPTSHTAILARSLGIPAVVAAPEARGLASGTLVLVDGGTGKVTVDPSPEAVAEVAAADASPRTVGGTLTADGHPVELLGNVGDAAGAAQVTACEADGIGLFRTEFSFLNRTRRPSIEEQARLYAAVLAEVPGRKVILRTLDAGADKPMPFLGAVDEPNPALGVRGYRATTDLLEDQLRAIAIAARVHGMEPWVMAPMVSTPAEARGFRMVARRYGIARAGVMIEVPAAAVMADAILAECDFVSIGTNDLTQYTMAADRQLGAVAELNDPWQPAVLRLVRSVAAAGTAHGKPVGVCGEAAADPLLACVLVGLGVTSLSMSPRALPAVAEAIEESDHAHCQAMAVAALGASSASMARTAAAHARETADQRAPARCYRA